MIRRAAPLLLLWIACGRESPTVAPIIVAPPPQAAPSPARVYRIDAEGKTTIDDDAPQVHIKAVTTGAGGSLTINPRDLAATRGDVKVDLASFTSKTFPDDRTNEALTESGRTWLEAVVAEKIDENMRWAVFHIAAIDEIDPSRDARGIPPVATGDIITRAVTLTARGDLLVHGRSSPQTVKLRAELAWPRDSDRDSPSSIAIRTVEPIRVTLADHAIVPRDMFGKEAKASFHLLGTKVGPTADVRVEVAAR